MPAPSDLVHETTTSTGTGNLTLANENGKRSFNTAFGTGGSNVFDYFISHRTAAEWERGTGSLSAATTLVRDTVLASSNSNNAVNFSAGTKDIANDIPAAKQARLDGAATWSAAQTYNPPPIVYRTAQISTSTGLTPEIQFTGNLDQSGAIYGIFANSAVGAQFNLLKSRNATVGSHTIVNSGDAIGALAFYGDDGTNYVPAAYIFAVVDGTPGTGDMPGRLTFSTSADGAASPTERMRITQAGAVHFPSVGTTASAANAFLDSGASPANQLLRSTSSLRYKREIEDMWLENAKGLLNARPVYYRSAIETDDQDHSHWGLIAEELADIDPRLVHFGYKDSDWDEVATPEAGAVRVLREGAQKVPDGVAYDRLTVPLLRLVQELWNEVQELKSKRRK